MLLWPPPEPKPPLKERRDGRRDDGGGRIPGERRNGRGEGGEEEELHASLVPPPPISERTDSSRGLTAARWFPPSRRSFLSLSSPRPRPAASPCPRPSAVCGGWLVPTHVYCPAHSLNDGLSPTAAVEGEGGETREPDTNQAKMRGSLSLSVTEL